MEEVARDPGILEELSSASREITSNLNRKSLDGLSAILECDPSLLDPSVVSETTPGSSPEEDRAGSIGSAADRQDPLVSIVLPFYNAEKHLKASVDSVAGHDYRNIELILVNDWSTDDSLQIARELAREDDRIRVLEHPRNMGAGPARNTGSLHARGKYLFFLDSDDILRRHSLDLLVRTAIKEDVKLVIGSCNQVDGSGNYGDYDRARDGGRPEAFGLIEGTEAMRRSLNVEEGSFLPVRPWGMLIDSAMFRESGLTFPPGEYEDLSVLPFLYKYAGKVVYLPDIAVTYRIREGSVTNSPLSLEKVERYQRLWDVISRRIEEFGVEGYRRDFEVFHVGHLLWLLDQGVTDEGVLDSVADLITHRMSLDSGSPGGKDNLHYMLRYINRIMISSGQEGNIRLWEKFVSHLGDDAIISYFRHRIFEFKE